MISPLKFLLTNQLKRPRKRHKTGGFTLIELLVALILAFLILAPLLGFMINIMDTDRREQAKASSEQELKAALDYMAEDLRQAVYIYDATRLDATNGIGNEIPPAVTAGVSGCNNSSPNQCTPVLVFWKRENKTNVVPPRQGVTCSTPPAGNPNPCNDTFVYSLVGYYLISGNNSNNTWSGVSRIARFEISGGVSNPFNSNNALITADGGFNDLSTVLNRGTGTIPQRMARWNKAASNYSINFGENVLIDYIDRSIALPANTLPPGGIGCTGSEVQIPSDLRANNNFYVCVNSTPPNNYARIYIRGNALARLRKNNTNYNSSQAAFFPTATIQVEGNGSLYTK